MTDHEQEQTTPTDKYIDIVFDGPPSHESGRFVEVEDPNGASINAGEWIDRGDGYWALRIGQVKPEAKPEPTARCEYCNYPVYDSDEQDKYWRCGICGSEDSKPVESLLAEMFPGTLDALDALSIRPAKLPEEGEN